jgi:hypothetical protein
MNIKTPLAREFEKDLSNRMEIYRPSFEEFTRSFDKRFNYISAEYYIYTPQESLFTKDGHISSRSVDLDAHKLLQDTIFKTIGLDDKLIREVAYRSAVSQDGKWNFVCIYNLEKISCLKSKYSLIASTIKPLREI